MIRFSLRCDSDHEFDGWFDSNASFEQQKKRGFVTCPHCNSQRVEKSLMAPQVATSRQSESAASELASTRKEFLETMKKMRDAVTEKGENVGKRFAEEARKIHYGETETRLVYGEADRAQVKGLVEEGVPILPLPVLPDDAN